MAGNAWLYAVIKRRRKQKEFRNSLAFILLTHGTGYKPISGQQTEDSYVNAFSWAVSDWNEIGVSPFLQNTNADYISEFADRESEGNFTFPASGGSGVINSVKLRF